MEIPENLIQRLESLAMQLGAPLDIQEDGVALALKGGAFHVAFAYSATLNQIARAVPGARWIKEEKQWRWPMEEYAAAREGRDALLATHRAMIAARASLIEDLRSADPRAIVKTAFERSAGKILQMNEYFVAQSNGPSVVMLHEKSALSRPVIVGEHLAIHYAKGLGVIQADPPVISESHHAH